MQTFLVYYRLYVIVALLKIRIELVMIKLKMLDLASTISVRLESKDLRNS
jgi:hypothetical protein